MSLFYIVLAIGLFITIGLTLYTAALAWADRGVRDRARILAEERRRIAIRNYSGDGGRTFIGRVSNALKGGEK